MEKKYFAESELIINEDGSIFHLHVKPEQLADKVILVGDPGRVDLVASHFDTKECAVESREFRTVTGTYKGKRITVISTGIGCDNIDIVMNEVDALANIDFETRHEKETLRSLEIVRIGTCGGLQLYTPAGTFVCSEYSIGFDGLLNFYAGRNAVLRLADGARTAQPPRLVGQYVPACTIRHSCRQGACGAHSCRRHGAWHHGSLRWLLRSAGTRAAHSAHRP